PQEGSPACRREEPAEMAVICRTRVASVDLNAACCIETGEPRSVLPLYVIDFFPPHFQSQPLLLGRRQLVPRYGKRLRRSAKPPWIARIQVRIGQDGVEPGNLGL